QQQRPAEEESRRWSIGLAQEHILPTSARHHRGQLGATKRAGNSEYAGQRPGNQQPPRRSHESRRLSRSNKNSRANHRPDHDHAGVHQTQTADEFRGRVVGSFAHNLRGYSWNAEPVSRKFGLSRNFLNAKDAKNPQSHAKKPNHHRKRASVINLKRSMK